VKQKPLEREVGNKVAGSVKKCLSWHNIGLPFGTNGAPPS
jgi:hypothetical protein